MKNASRMFFFVLTIAFPFATRAQSSNDHYAKNNSYLTNCAEYDNINVPIYSTMAGLSDKAPGFELKATHPSYIGSISSFSNCPADFSGSDCQKNQNNATPTPFPGAGWSTEKDGSGNTVAYCKMLFDDHINRFDICRTPTTWWRNRAMTVKFGQISESGNYIKLIKKISDTNSWPEIMVLYQDGNLRLKPHPPRSNNLQDVCYGSSVILGPAPEDKTRPFVDIDQISIDPGNLCLDISYLNGGSAHVCLAIDRTEALITVNPNYGISTPIATLRSMWVADGNADVDHIKSDNIISPVLGTWGQLSGSSFSFYRSTKSIHNPEAPDIAINFATSELQECLFNWAEVSYPSLFSPTGAITQLLPPYRYRYYQKSNSYLGVSSSDNHVYYLSANAPLQDVGGLYGWLREARCK